MHRINWKTVASVAEISKDDLDLRCRQVLMSLHWVERHKRPRSGMGSCLMRAVWANLSLHQFHTSLTPQKSQKNHTGQQFWPNLFHGTMVTGVVLVSAKQFRRL